MIISRLLKSWIATHTFESGVLEQGNIENMQDRSYLWTRVEDHWTKVRDILLEEEARTRRTHDKEAPPPSQCMSAYLTCKCCSNARVRH